KSLHDINAMTALVAQQNQIESLDEFDLIWDRARIATSISHNIKNKEAFEESLRSGNETTHSLFLENLWDEVKKDIDLRFPGRVKDFLAFDIFDIADDSTEKPGIVTTLNIGIEVFSETAKSELEEYLTSIHASFVDKFNTILEPNQLNLLNGLFDFSGKILTSEEISKEETPFARLLASRHSAATTLLPDTHKTQHDELDLLLSA
ncbi:hypothetical protein ACFL3D_05585, partial [Candidatus Omnitrophota bacterium]